MTDSTQLTIAQPATDTALAEPQQLLAVNPARYVHLVFQSVRDKLARYKTEADALPAPDVSTVDGMKTAILWRAKFRDEIRIAAETARKERKAPILEIGRLLDGRAKEIAAEVAPYEARFDDAIKAHEAKIAAEKAARAEAERVRVAEIQRRLGKIRALPEVYNSSMPPERLSEIVAQLETGLSFDYAEFADEAEAARQAAIIALRAAHAAACERVEREEAERTAREAEEARKAAERHAEEARLAEVRRKLDAEQAEQRARAEAERKEQARVAEIRQWIVALNGPTHLTSTDSPMLIETAIKTLRGSPIDERYGEFRREAQDALDAGLVRLAALLDSAKAHHAELARLATERVALERQQAEQAARQAEIDRRDREQRETAERQAREAAEAETRRIAAEQAERERQEAEAARQCEAEARNAQLRERISQLQAWEIADIVAQELGMDGPTVAARIVEIPREDWLALAMLDQEAAA